MFELLVEVLGVRHIISRKDGQRYTLVDFGVPSTYEKFSVFVFDESLVSVLESKVREQVKVRFMLKGGYSVSLQVVAVEQ